MPDFMIVSVLPLAAFKSPLRVTAEKFVEISYLYTLGPIHKYRRSSVGVTIGFLENNKVGLRGVVLSL